MNNNMNPLHFRMDPNAKHEFGTEYIPIIPNEAEVRYLGGKYVDCKLYIYSLEVEKNKANRQQLTTYASCEQFINNLYECFTDSLYGKSIQDAPSYTLNYVKLFSDCMSNNQNLFKHCSNQFSDIIRAIFRSDDNKLK